MIIVDFENIYNALLVFTLLNITDIITTWNVIRKYSEEHELNPIARWLIKKYKAGGLFLLKYFGMGFVVLIGLLTSNLAYSIWILNIILAGVTAWNLYVNYKLFTGGEKLKQN